MNFILDGNIESFFVLTIIERYMKYESKPRFVKSMRIGIRLAGNAKNLHANVTTPAVEALPDPDASDSDRVDGQALDQNDTRHCRHLHKSHGSLN